MYCRERNHDLMRDLAAYEPMAEGLKIQEIRHDHEKALVGFPITSLLAIDPVKGRKEGKSLRE